MGGMLENKVVVISGVGPRWGPPWRVDVPRRAPTWCWRRGLSNDSKTSPSRLPTSVAGRWRRHRHHRRGQVDNLVKQTLDAYGKVDVLINNAFKVPSMKPFANTSFEHIRETLELTVLGALRMIRASPRRSSGQRVRW